MTTHQPNVLWSSQTDTIITVVTSINNEINCYWPIPFQSKFNIGNKLFVFIMGWSIDSILFVDKKSHESIKFILHTTIQILWFTSCQPHLDDGCKFFWNKSTVPCWINYHKYDQNIFCWTSFYSISQNITLPF